MEVLVGKMGLSYPTNEGDLSATTPKCGSIVGFLHIAGVQRVMWAIIDDRRAHFEKMLLPTDFINRCSMVSGVIYFNRPGQKLRLAQFPMPMGGTVHPKPKKQLHSQGGI